MVVLLYHTYNWLSDDADWRSSRRYHGQLAHDGWWSSCSTILTTGSLMPRTVGHHGETMGIWRMMGVVVLLYHSYDWLSDGADWSSSRRNNRQLAHDGWWSSCSTILMTCCLMAWTGGHQRGTMGSWHVMSGCCPYHSHDWQSDVRIGGH